MQARLAVVAILILAGCASEPFTFDPRISTVVVQSDGKGYGSGTVISSGGGVYDSNGELVGIMTSASATGASLVWFTPSTMIRAFIIGATNARGDR